MLEKIMRVNTAKPYDILFSRGGIHRVGEWCAQIFEPGSKALIVTDFNIPGTYRTDVTAGLARMGFDPASFHFPAGEESKRLSTVEQIFGVMADHRMTRTDFVVALGGGVTGDIAGFAAATYLRGIPFVQVPTSLLAQVDSSVGGKTGVDLPTGKNLVGAFHQPALVVIDTETLATLPPRYLADGMGEVIKYGCIKSRALFDSLKNQGSFEAHLDDVIYQCVDIKRALVEEDEFDTGARMLLNFGHTFGHAIEALQNFSGFSHGEAVGAGMVLMCRVSEAAGLTKPGTAEEIAGVLAQYRLPAGVDLEPGILTAATCVDKKSSGDNINLVLLKELGESFIYRRPRADFVRMAEALE